MSTSKKIQVTRLAHVHYQHPDLTKAATFLNDFGLTCVHKEEGRIYFAGYGVDPFCYIAEQSPENKRKFLGGTWLLASEEDLHLATSHPQASKIQSLDAPGGGQKVSITDPNGATVNFIFGQQLREKTQDNSITRDKDTPTPQLNSAYQKPRQGHWRRFDAGPSPVHKLGHYGYMVPEAKYKETFDFYTSLMNLKPTDSVFHPETQEDKTCFMHIDLGKQFTDHHSFFIGASQSPVAHVHHASFEINDFDTQSLGHDWLQKQGWVNCWGIGRHVLGSQIFDYWFDASGNILEHYSDGDLVNEDTPWERSPESPNSLYIWGPNIPLAFVTGQIADAGKAIPVLPKHEAVAAA